MQKKLFISWLCLIFLSTIFVGCKPQEHPPKSSLIVRQAHQPGGLDSPEKIVQKAIVSETPAFVEQKETSETLPEEEPILNDDTVIIIAVLEDKTEEIKAFHGRIDKSVPHSLPEIFVSTTNISGNKIIFPPIPSGLQEIRVRISGENIPNCYSRTFDTIDGEDKEVIVEIPLTVTLKGTALSPEGLPITDSLSFTVFPIDKSEGVFQAGTLYKEQVQPEIDGSYESSKLGQGFFEISFRHSDYKLFQTNLCLIPPEAELNFTFVKIPVSELHGIVVHCFDNKPIEGVTVNAHPWSSQPPYASCVTDSKGEFLLELKEEHEGFFGEISVDESGYGKVVKQINSRCKFVKIILRQAGTVIGKVTTEDGKPVKGINITMDMIRNYSVSVKKVSPNSDNDTRYYRTVSDSDGNFKFSNVIAPAKYGFQINNYDSNFSLPPSCSDNGFTVDVEPDKTAECNLIVQRTGTIALKAQDDKGKPVLKYDFIHKIRMKKGPMYSSSLKKYVALSEKEWFYVKPGAWGAGLFSCTASEPGNNLSLITNDIPFSGQVTNYITLVFSSEKAEPNLTGFLFNPDGSPAKGNRIRAWIRGKGFVDAIVDETGYFELVGLKTEKGKKMNVEASSWAGKFHVHTNFPSGTIDVKLKFNPPYQVTGKVFLDDLNSPAKNFVVNQNYNKQSYSSDDGAFVFEMEQPRHKGMNREDVTISVDGYLPGFGKYDFTKSSVFDAGNIILKPGKTANINGRVINQYEKPLFLWVFLEYKDLEKKFSAHSGQNDGSFGFEGVPPGNATISAKSILGFSASHDFEIKDGEDIELPDLVLTYTNSAVVTFTFKLPDGSSPGNTRFINNGFYIRSDGTLNRSMHAGTYSGWKINFGGKNYVADDFIVTESTDKLEVQMREETK